MNLAGFLGALVSVVLLLWSMALKPDRLTCPPGWYLMDGVRRDGSFSCQRPPIGGDEDVYTGHDSAVDQPGVLRSRVHCTGGARPVIWHDGRTVGCQR